MSHLVLRSQQLHAHGLQSRIESFSICFDRLFTAHAIAGVDLASAAVQDAVTETHVQD